ncbi:Rieske 2Fe-2S domain-containing protein [Streptomyces sp. YGL11-2]|uniref:Rieske 2Fe-2S domain-containing protein n=1 Tax=Streptomyces sp. YGL11-2 TaxID=3414028 RepID=UPI003CE6B4A1
MDADLPELCTRSRATDGQTPDLPYPSGWFCLAHSRELARGSVLTRQLAGEDVVLYRTGDGQSYAVHPYCPHLGAHLGVGGTIEGQNLVCPFHRFAFAPDGSCVGTPKGPHPRARLKHRTVRERNGFVIVWYGHDDTPPAWEIPDTSPPEVTVTATWATDVHAHVQELAENGLDYRHLPAVHHVDVRQLVPPQAQGPYLRSHLRLGPNRPTALKKIRYDVSFLLAGLGYVRAEIPVPPLGCILHLWAVHAPTGPRLTRLLLGVACTDIQRTRPAGRTPLLRPVHRALARAVLWTAVSKAKDDVRIWNAKRYEPRPRLAAGDEAIGFYRHWARQFYPTP